MEPNDEVKLGQLSPYRTIKPGEKFKYEGGILPIGSFLGEIKIGYGVVIEEASVFYGNNFIGHNVVVRPRCIIGKYSELRVNSWLAEGVTIGEHSVIYNYANIAMGTLIGNYVYFGVHSITTNANDIVLHRGRPFIPNPVRIKDGARIATSVTILPGVVIGENSLVGAGSVVTKDIPDGEIWYGNPAKKRGEVNPEDCPMAMKAGNNGNQRSSH
jgi:UDP-2-acetamido-3-amino-2,3-dideoxy-glucuronate N-acetyltransferase